MIKGTETTDRVNTITASIAPEPMYASTCGRLATSDTLPHSASPKLGDDVCSTDCNMIPDTTNHTAAIIASTTPKYASPSGLRVIPYIDSSNPVFSPFARRRDSSQRPVVMIGPTSRYPD